MPIQYKIISSDKITTVQFWPSLHRLLNSAYEPFRDDWPLPQPFYRLHPEIPKAAEQLVESLGSRGVMCIALLTDTEEDREGEFDGTPIACAAIMEFEGGLSSGGEITKHERSSNKVDQVMALGSSAIEEIPAVTPLPDTLKVPIWEFNMVSTSRAYQGKGVAQTVIKLLEDHALKIENGEKVHMIARTIEEISGPFWRKRGYKTLEDAWITLPKGFTHMEGHNGLPRDVLLWTGEKWLIRAE
jgi:GNAT superfamily N-acetyltransferase